jgi:hypothetical protein
MTALVLVDEGRLLSFDFEDLLDYHGPGSPAGVAHGFKVMERAFPLLSDAPLERRTITVATSFHGPGARDAFELVTRAVTGDRFTLDDGLAEPELGWASEQFVFRLGHQGLEVTLAVRPGIVSDAFIALARTPDRSPEDEERFRLMKLDGAAHVMSLPAAEVYDVLP